jgi:hypothetical protein
VKKYTFVVRIIEIIHTIGYHRNYSGRWLVATMSASKSISLMCDFTSLPEFDFMFMFAVKSYLHSWYDPLTTVDMFELNTTSNTRGHSKKMKIKKQVG